MLAQLLDRVAAVLEDARVAVDVGDRAAAGGRVHVRRVVGHQPEVVGIDLDLAQVDRAHGAVRDRQLVGLPGAVVGHGERVAAGAAVGVRVAAAGLGLGAHWPLLSVSVLCDRLWGMAARPPAAPRRTGQPQEGLRRGAAACASRWRRACAGARGGGPGVRAAARRRRPARAGGGGGAGAGRSRRPGPSRSSGGLPHSPAHDQEQRHDRDLQEEHQPDEGPDVHACDRIPGGEAARSGVSRMWGGSRCAQPRSASGAPLNCVIACSSSMRATISRPSGARRARCRTPRR